MHNLHDKSTATDFFAASGQRSYEVSITEFDDGWGWNIEVHGNVIATSHGHVSRSPRGAFDKAKAWAWHHKQMGYEFRPEWWSAAA